MSVKLPDNFQMREHSWPCRFHINYYIYHISALDTSRTLFLLASTQGVSCRLVMNHLIYMYMFSLIPPPPPPPPHIYVSKCMYVYVHISLFLPECACTTIIDISPRIFKLIYCCVSIIMLFVLLLCINHNCYLYMPSWGPDLVNKLISISIFILGEINKTHDSRIFSTEKKKRRKCDVQN